MSGVSSRLSPTIVVPKSSGRVVWAHGGFRKQGACRGAKDPKDYMRSSCVSSPAQLKVSAWNWIRNSVLCWKLSVTWFKLQFHFVFQFCLRCSIIMVVFVIMVAPKL